MTGYRIGLVLRLLAAGALGWDLSRHLWRGSVGLAVLWLMAELLLAAERRTHPRGRSWGDEPRTLYSELSRPGRSGGLGPGPGNDHDDWR